MSAADRYVHGSWNVTCQRCGFKYKAEQIEQEPYTKFLVCRGPGTNDCWEPRHPQEYLKPRPFDNSKVAYVRPEPNPNFVEVSRVAEDVGVQE